LTSQREAMLGTGKEKPVGTDVIFCHLQGTYLGSLTITSVNIKTKLKFQLNI
jgi:hypothetical protein